MYLREELAVEAVMGRKNQGMCGKKALRD